MEKQSYADENNLKQLLSAQENSAVGTQSVPCVRSNLSEIFA